MITIDVPADLHFEDDEGFILACVPDTGSPRPGQALVAGTPRGWTWAVVQDVEDGWLRLRRVTAREAASHNSLVAS